MAPSVQDAIIEGILAQGCDVVDIGLASTPMGYYAIGKIPCDGGLVVTASHNPKQYIGFKLCRKEARPMSADTGIKDVEKLVRGPEIAPAAKAGKRDHVDVKAEFVQHIANFAKGITPMTIVVDYANGMGANESPAIFSKIPGLKVVPLYEQLDGTFPNHEANPLKGLTKEQVEKIFTGETPDWSGVVDIANAKRRGPGKISIYTRNTSSGTYSDFKDLAMSKRDYAPSSQKMAGNEQIASEVAKNPDGIGYVGISYIKTPGVKALTIDGRSPSASAVKGLNYAYGRQCFFYTNGVPSGKGKPFVDFSLSPAGQKIVEQVGFITVK